MTPSHLRVAFRFLTSSTEERITGLRRAEFLDVVWDMYVKTYSAIGMAIPNAAGLLKYEVWDLNMSNGRPVAFTLYKQTSFGLKSGALGSDGSSEGKSAAVSNLRTQFKKPGIYGEVSHKVKDIALAAGAPAVCAAFVSQVLGKHIEQVGDLEYRRNLEGVGNVQKMLLGRPRGIPTTDSNRPSCPASLPESRMASEQVDAFNDLDSHYACLL